MPPVGATSSSHLTALSCRSLTESKQMGHRTHFNCSDELNKCSMQGKQ